jgi:DNA-binding transcriptional MerR regulator
MTETEDTRPTPKEEESKRDPEKRKKHNRDYYQRNKEKIKEALNKRYMEDPAYKEEIRRRTKEANKKRAMERKARLKVQHLVRESPSMYKVVLPDGREIQTEMYTTSQLAVQLERLSSVIRKWEMKGYIPKALYRNLQNMRLYTAFQVERILYFYKFEARAHGMTKMKTNLKSTDFFRRVQALWRWFPYGVEEFEVPHDESED